MPKDVSTNATGEDRVGRSVLVGSASLMLGASPLLLARRSVAVSVIRPCWRRENEVILEQALAPLVAACRHLY